MSDNNRPYRDIRQAEFCIVPPMTGWKGRVLLGVMLLFLLTPLLITVVALLAESSAGSVVAVAYELSLLYLRILPMLGLVLGVHLYMRSLKLAVDDAGIAFRAPGVFGWNPSFRLPWDDLEKIEADALGQQIVLQRVDGKSPQRLRPALWSVMSDQGLNLTSRPRMRRFVRHPLTDFPLYQAISDCSPDSIRIAEASPSTHPTTVDLGRKAQIMAVAAVLCISVSLVMLLLTRAVVLGNGFLWSGFALVTVLILFAALLLLRNDWAERPKRAGLLLTAVLFASCFGYLFNVSLNLLVHLQAPESEQMFELVRRDAGSSFWQDSNRQWDAVELDSEYLQDHTMTPGQKVPVPVKSGVWDIYQFEVDDFRAAVKKINSQRDEGGEHQVPET